MAGLERAITNVSGCLHVSAEVSWREAVEYLLACNVLLVAGLVLRAM